MKSTKYPKISVITASYNRVNTINSSIESLKGQSYPNIEHVYVDGGSVDGTIDLIQRALTNYDKFVTEPDNGIYDALNKGITMSTGDVVGLLHSDDYFSDKNVLADVAKHFLDKEVDLVYGDLSYVSGDSCRVVRRWESGAFDKKRLKYGWMPPHPTVFIRKSVFEKIGVYDASYRIAADYDFLLRCLQADLVIRYIPRNLVNMRVGGASNANLANLIKKSKEDLKSIRRNRVGGWLTLLYKNLSKIMQFL
ncbi:glycosyltransferase family 2 protein [uncultured Paraglaciecola sp.]|uniref:glycosyltransferase family 2 protein n=1 Tax=uncultured Paraglaciecola sp. TaxID=1765024 RepID=UPI0025D5D533|nr:glycosyltransferase family 2 protein [uncultured Paraglaciecola sp.]